MYIEWISIKYFKGEGFSLAKKYFKGEGFSLAKKYQISCNNIEENCKYLQTSYTFGLWLKVWSTTQAKLKYLRLAYTSTSFNISCSYQPINFNVLPKTLQ
jgi:hypothetical protein